MRPRRAPVGEPGHARAAAGGYSPDDADEIHIPAALNLLFQSTYDWDYRTVPQERAAGRAIYWPRGRMLGGSSSMNAMIYIRGARHDYDTWRDEYGCTGWGYTDLMPYFLPGRGQHPGRVGVPRRGRAADRLGPEAQVGAHQGVGRRRRVPAGWGRTRTSTGRSKMAAGSTR